MVVLVAGCAAFDVLGDLTGDLEDAGFESVTANVSPTNASLVVISADAPRGRDVAEAQDEAAEVVWTRFPRRFEALRITIDGEREEWTYAELEDQLGSRPDDLDTSTEIGDEWTRMSVAVVLGLVAAGVVAILVIGLVVLLVVRANRRNAANRPQPRPQPWMPPGMPATGGPVPPPGGWAPVGAPPGPPAHPAPPVAPPTLAKAPVGPTTGPAPVAPAGRRPRDPDARRLGRRPRGRVPDKAHTPPGWG